jgi:hypothetical protein
LVQGEIIASHPIDVRRPQKDSVARKYFWTAFLCRFRFVWFPWPAIRFHRSMGKIGLGPEPLNAYINART